MTPTDVPPAPRPRPPRTAAAGSSPEPTPATPLHLWVRGGLRRRIVLTDGGDEALAELTMPGSRRARRRQAGTAEDRDGVTWEMRDEDGDGVTVRRDGVVHAAVRGRELQVGDRRYVLVLYPDGLRSASVRAAEGTPLLQVRAQSGRRRRPWAVLRPGSAGPLALPGMLAVTYTLLTDEADAEGGSVSDLFWSLVRPWEWGTGP
ncbi:hypothetical protein [Patulibacter americanus]|uniref:hypothetical protein n=1 Tax=Patulibacter americanus TaxID=588672 RepID=UPI0003B3A21C|nr:hypothetical protein [Patulibacter americanus]